jgi:hypothetical protein
LAHPFSRRISNKRFVDCELIGPAVIVISRSTFYGATFSHCDLVVADGRARVLNAIAIEGSEIIGGSISRCTIIMPPAMAEAFRQMQGANFITSMGDAGEQARHADQS